MLFFLERKNLIILFMDISLWPDLLSSIVFWIQGGVGYHRRYGQRTGQNKYFIRETIFFGGWEAFSYLFMHNVLHPVLLPAHEFRQISHIREFSINGTENSTEFLCYLQNWLKTPQKASVCYQNVKKVPENSSETLKRLPKIAHNFYKFVKSTQESSRFKN